MMVLFATAQEEDAKQQHNAAEVFHAGIYSVSKLPGASFAAGGEYLSKGGHREFVIIGGG
jgi:hypothetical protein